MKTTNFKVKWYRRDNTTFCQIKKDENDEIVVEGVAKKHVNDQSNKKISRWVSFKRAMDQAMNKNLLNKEERSELWNNFRDNINQPQRSIKLPKVA